VTNGPVGVGIRQVVVDLRVWRTPKPSSVFGRLHVETVGASAVGRSPDASREATRASDFLPLARTPSRVGCDRARFLLDCRPPIAHFRVVGICSESHGAPMARRGQPAPRAGPARSNGHLVDPGATPLMPEPAHPPTAVCAGPRNSRPSPGAGYSGGTPTGGSRGGLRCMRTTGLAGNPRMVLCHCSSAAPRRCAGLALKSQLQNAWWHRCSC